MGETRLVIIDIGLIYTEGTFRFRAPHGNQRQRSCSLEPANENVIIHRGAYRELGIIAKHIINHGLGPHLESIQ